MDKEELVSKLTSRKFWVCVAAFLGSIGTGLAGFATGNTAITTTGMICATLSAAVYAAVEASVDHARESSNNTQTIKQVTATATASDKATVQTIAGENNV